ncbi:right-handed parallel beta-helix repeat-containing protein [Luteolibacter sp. SL250]|uniref:right-handed parallel beta-helix repeat-containing protein n=1 Tax=Luteolibacter sp. SL250 TaxID=2995170 RepID=UPI00227129EE|nr:right-handed parallel beta-helix repeat-containing protein [Luteolibacter sp. SL250]WAC20697.1 right-handed parallel beta-helix repeat-containing protein [Luteolibacter sp. SL250]
MIPLLKPAALAAVILSCISPALADTGVSLADYADHKKGDDWAPAIRKAFADSPTVNVPEGRYLTSRVEFSDGMTLRGAGEGTVFVPLGTRLFDINGEAGKEVPVAADIVDFSDGIDLESADGLTAGDDILIRGQRNSMIREGTAGLHYATDWVLGRTRKSSCFYGEFDTVKSIDGPKLTTAGKRIFPGYFKDDSREPPSLGKDFVQRKSTTVSKLSLVRNVTLRDFAVEGTRDCHMPFRVRYAKDCLLENIAFTTNTESFKKDGTPDLSVVYAIYVRNTTVRNFRVELSPELLAVLDAKEKVYKNFSNYNLFKIISSTASGLEGCSANGGTHPFNITRSASVEAGGGIPSIGCFIRNCTASNCIWSGIKVQQACYDTEVSGNTVTASAQGIITCGRNTRITDNRLTTTVPHSADYYYTHVTRGGTMGVGVIEGYACGSIVRNNIIDGFRSGLAMVDGYEDKNCFEEGNILFENNAVSGCLRGFTLYKNPHCVSLGRNDLKVVIRNNTFSRAAGKDGQPATGIHLPDQSAGLEIRSNAFRGFDEGVWMGGLVDLIDISGNGFEDCGTGMTLGEISPDAAGAVVRIRESGNTLTRTARISEGLGHGHVKGF